MYESNNSNSKSSGILASVIKFLIYGFFALVGIYFVVQFCREFFFATVNGVHSLTHFLDNLASSFVNAITALVALPFNVVDSIINWIFH